jgi:hypothetical protein
MHATNALLSESRQNKDGAINQQNELRSETA